MRYVLAIIAALMLTALGCDTSDRVSRLEKQVQELQVKVGKDQAVIDYDLQAKCAKDAKTWFDEGWADGGKGNILLDHSNHYNKALNKCFTEVEHHYYSEVGRPDWTNNISLWDVYENTKYGNFAENHDTLAGKSIDDVIICEFRNQKCMTLDEFNELVRPYMNN